MAADDRTEDLIPFRRISGKHRHRHRNGRVEHYGPGDIIFVEDPAELGNTLDVWECLEPNRLNEEPEPVVGLVAEHRGAGRWNVVREDTGEVVNDRYLTRAEAESLTLTGTFPDEGTGE